jgi:hypothetical protein
LKDKVILLCQSLDPPSNPPLWPFAAASQLLPKGFHRIRHYGLLASGGATRAQKLARARELIAAPGQLACELIAAAAQLRPPQQHPPHDGTCEDTTHSEDFDHPCPHCGSRMVIIETFEPGHRPHHRPSAPVIIIPINTS